MTSLKSAYQTRGEIPTGYIDLYEQIDDTGWYVLTGVEELSLLRRDKAYSENAIQARIDAAVARATRDIKSPSFRRRVGYAIEEIRRLFSHAPIGDNARNPWAAEAWNITQQGRYIVQYGVTAATNAAKSVGSRIGATRPRQVTA